MYTYKKKILKDNDAEPTALEAEVAKALFDIQNSSVNELKSDLGNLYFSAAREVDSGDKKAIIMFVPFRLLRQFQKVQSRLVHELEKKFSGKNVVIIAQRKILAKPGRNNRVKKQKRPRSRCLTNVHNAILKDIVYPTEITGKRLRFKTDGSKVEKIYLDKKDKQSMEDRVDTFSAVYKKLTGKDAVFTFEPQSQRS